MAVGWDDCDGKPDGKLLVKDSIADITLQQVLTRPSEFDVMATTNLNGDYLSDALAAQVGGIGIAPGGNINYVTGHGIFEATHGTAPKYAGQDKVNPGSVLLSGVMMYEHLGWTERRRRHRHRPGGDHRRQGGHLRLRPADGRRHRGEVLGVRFRHRRPSVDRRRAAPGPARRRDARSTVSSRPGRFDRSEPLRLASAPWQPNHPSTSPSPGPPVRSATRSLFRIASGQLLGPDQPVVLRLLEIEPGMKALEGVVMEIDDCAFPLVSDIVTTTDLDTAFDGTSWALLVGSIPRKAGMERGDLLTRQRRDLRAPGPGHRGQRRLGRAGAGGRQPLQHQLPHRPVERPRGADRPLVRHDPARREPGQEPAGPAGRGAGGSGDQPGHLGQPLRHPVPRLRQCPHRRQAGRRGHRRQRVAAGGVPHHGAEAWRRHHRGPGSLLGGLSCQRRHRLGGEHPHRDPRRRLHLVGGRLPRRVRDTGRACSSDFRCAPTDRAAGRWSKDSPTTSSPPSGSGSPPRSSWPSAPTWSTSSPNRAPDRRRRALYSGTSSIRLPKGSSTYHCGRPGTSSLRRVG